MYLELMNYEEKKIKKYIKEQTPLLKGVIINTQANTYQETKNFADNLIG